MRPCRVRLHLIGDLGSIEGLLLQRPRTLAGYFKLVDAAFLESRVDRHELENLATRVPREKVRIEELLKP